MSNNEKLIPQKDTKKVSNILDSDNPPLQQTIYEKLKKKIISIFNQFEKRLGWEKKTQEKQKSWYEKLKHPLLMFFGKKKT